MKKRMLFTSILVLFISMFFILSTRVNASTEQTDEERIILHDEKEDVDYWKTKVGLVSEHLKKTISYEGVFSDDIFFKPSTKYNHFLARQSIGLAMSAFQLFDEDGIETGDTNDKGTLADYLVDNDFNEIRIDDYEKETSLYTVGSAIAKKTITKDDENYDLIVVAIRGGKYKKEWESNMTLGIDYRHQGFNYAAQLVTDRVLGYISLSKYENPIKLWITGFSRAAAIANIVSANLNESLFLSEEDIYSYTFATPQVTTRVEKEYKNIFNIIGASDLVPQVPPHDWGFQRYGRDIFLPGAEFNSDFNYKYTKVQNELKKLGIDTYYNVDLNFRNRILAGILFEFGSDLYNYNLVIQDLFVDLLEKKEINEYLNLIRKTLIEWEKETPENNDSKDNFINYLVGMLPDILTGKGFMKDKVSTSKGKASLIAHEHYPELYLYWLYNFTEEELFDTNNNFAYVILNGNARYEIKDKDANQILFEIDSKGNKTISQVAKDNNLDITLLSYGGKTIIVLPYDRNYELSYVANNNTNIDIEIIPYDRAFTSSLAKHSDTIKAEKDERGVILSINDNTTTYNFKESMINTSTLAKKLRIDKGPLSYKSLLIFITILVGLLIGLLIFIVDFFNSKILKNKINVLRLITVVLSITFLLVTELSYWLFPDAWWIEFMFMMFTVLSVITYMVITKKDYKKVFRPLDNAFYLIVLLLIGLLVYQFNLTAGLALSLGGVLFMVIRYLIKNKPKRQLWLALLLLTIITEIVLFILLKKFNINNILIFVLAPATLLWGLLTDTYDRKNITAYFMVVLALISMVSYYFVSGFYLMHVTYKIFMGLGIFLYVVKDIDKDEQMLILNENLIEE